MGVVLAFMLQLLKLCIIAFAVTAQESKGSIISPAPAFLPVIPPRAETLGPIYNGEGSKAPNLPSDGDGSVISPSPANLHVYHSASSPAIPNGPFSQPPKTLPPPTAAPSPQKIKDIEPSKSPSPSTIALSPPYAVVPSPSVVQGSKPPSVKTSPPQREAPTVRLPVSTPTAPAPVAISSGRSPKTLPVSQPIEHGNLAPNVDNRNANNSHLAEPFSPAPGAVPSTNLPKNSSGSQPTEHATFPPKEGTNNGHGPEAISPAPIAVNWPKESPISQPPKHASLPQIVHQRNANVGHNLKPVSPASVAIPPTTYKIKSMDSEPTQNGSIAPNVHKSNTNEGHTSETVSTEPVASPPWKVENNPPEAHPIVATITPSILTAPVTSPPSAFPLKPPLVHPIVPVASPSKLPAPVACPTPLRSFNWKKGGASAVAPLSRNQKPLPAVIHAPAQAPAAQQARQLHHAPEPLISSPKSSSNEEYHSHPLPPRSEQRHHVPPSMNSSSSVSPFSSPIHSNVGQVSPAPSSSIRFASHLTEIPPSESSSKIPKNKIHLLPQVQALPPPPPNEDCLSTVCAEPYTNSPPGEPCRCVWPMRVGLRLSVSLYTFFPLVSELASEIATGVFMGRFTKTGVICFLLITF